MKPMMNKDKVALFIRFMPMLSSSDRRTKIGEISHIPDD
jgi:hypothetical protein